jgi:small ligand-binding sensory domain FIST
MQFRHAHAAHTDWAEATRQCLAQLEAQAASGAYERHASLGFLYLTEPLQANLDEILATLKSRTGIPNWVGSSGVGICATGIEYVDEPALSIMLGQFTPGSVNVFSGTQRPPTLGTRTDSGAQAAFTALIHVDPQTPDLPELVLDMAGKVESEYLFGGLSSGRQRTRQIADRALSGGLSGAVFSSDVQLVSRVSQGAHPLPGARRHEVTKASNNLILELDGRPAFDVLLEDAGIRERAAMLSGADTPREDFVRVRQQLLALGRRGLFVGIEPDSGTGYRERTPRVDYVIRHVVALDPGKGTIAVGAQMDEGQQLRFCTRDEAAARKDLIRICAEIRDHVDEQRSASGSNIAKGAVYVSCVGRGSHMFGEQSEELRVIKHHLGDVPLVGFYASGEIGGRNLYGFTGVLTVFY